MAFSTLLAASFMKPFPSARSSTNLFARYASHLLPARTTAPLITASDSDSDDTEAPMPKGCPLKNPFLARGRFVPYAVKDRDESFQAKVDLPGISKEDLRVWVESNYLNIKAEEEKEDGDDEAVSDEDHDDEEEVPRMYFGSIPIPEGQYKMDQIQAQMRNGVLKLLVPKLKLEERKDIIIVNVNN